jgi:hypothetical protein
MAERPLVWSGRLVRSAMAGRVKHLVIPAWPQPAADLADLDPSCAPCRPGDLYWIREAWYPEGGDVARARESGCIAYRADGEMPAHAKGERWRSASRMPRWASRLAYVVTDVSGKRLEGITQQEAIRAGYIGRDICPAPDRCEHPDECAFDAEWALSQDIASGPNGEHLTWRQNPWLWIVRVS